MVGELGNQFEEIGKTFQNIPHLVIGKENKKSSLIRCPYCNNLIKIEVPEQKKQIDEFVNYHRKKFNTVQWFLYICISLIVGYAVYRLIWG